MLWWVLLFVLLVLLAVAVWAVLGWALWRRCRVLLGELTGLGRDLEVNLARLDGPDDR